MALPGAFTVFSDCQAVQRDCSRGPRWATASNRMYARVWTVLNAASDEGENPLPIIWMPAHTAEHDEGVLFKSDGTLLSARDRRANAMADRMAKVAAAGRRHQRHVRERLRTQAEQVAGMALWLARATVEANAFKLADGRIVRDSTAGKPVQKRMGKRKRDCNAEDPASPHEQAFE
eukprot:5565922-Karenia_brevis.AAC.1